VDAQIRKWHRVASKRDLMPGFIYTQLAPDIIFGVNSHALKSIIPANTLKPEKATLHRQTSPEKPACR
jgi:hypothetical protein